VPEHLLTVEDLTRHYSVPCGVIGTLTNAPRRTVRAVDGVSFTLDGGEALALVGESGCGKTTTALTVLGLVEPTSGMVRFEGRPWHAELRRDRALRRAAQLIFQDPYESLSPRMKVGELVAEPLLIHRIGTAEERRTRAYAALDEDVLGANRRDRPGGDADRRAAASLHPRPAQRRTQR
jgi:peptide/nickel transport system ATP-binding protein